MTRRPRVDVLKRRGLFQARRGPARAARGDGAADRERREGRRRGAPGRALQRRVRREPQVREVRLTGRAPILM